MSIFFEIKRFLFEMELMPAIDTIFTNTFMAQRLIPMRQMKKIGEVKRNHYHHQLVSSV